MRDQAVNVMKKYDCVAHIGEAQAEAKAEIGEDRIVVTGGVKADLLFADILDMRLLNYTLILTMKEGEARLSKMGYDTEDFFEQLWLAFTKESKKSLFVTGDAEIFVEGDYTLEEEGVAKKGIAKLALHKDCICMIPHNITGRRIPLCFSCAPEREDFKVEISLDTREKYGFGRLGHHTEPFFERLNKNRAVTVKQWTEAHVRLENELESRMGGAADRLLILKDTGANVVSGLFSPDDEENFWIAAVRDDRAAVELMTDEDTATYLYRFDIGADVFVSRLRHAMEAVKKNRRMIYISDEELHENLQYRMAADRSSHVRFLRECTDGRVIHTGGWESKIREFFS